MVTLCLFNTLTYGTGAAGFLKAKADGAVTDVAVDIGQCSYSIMYSVHNAAIAAAKCLDSSSALEMGAYVDDVYASINEMDEICNEDPSETWDDLEAGFNLAIEARVRKLVEALGSFPKLRIVLEGGSVKEVMSSVPLLIGVEIIDLDDLEDEGIEVPAPLKHVIS